MNDELRRNGTKAPKSKFTPRLRASVPIAEQSEHEALVDLADVGGLLDRALGWEGAQVKLSCRRQ